MSWKDEWDYHRQYKAAVEEACNMVMELAARIASTKTLQLQTVER